MDGVWIWIFWNWFPFSSSVKRATRFGSTILGKNDVAVRYLVFGDFDFFSLSLSVINTWTELVILFTIHRNWYRFDVTSTDFVQHIVNAKRLCEMFVFVLRTFFCIHYVIDENQIQTHTQSKHRKIENRDSWIENRKSKIENLRDWENWNSMEVDQQNGTDRKHIS